MARLCFQRTRGKFPEGERRRPEPRPPGVAAGPGLRAGLVPSPFQHARSGRPGQERGASGSRGPGLRCRRRRRSVCPGAGWCLAVPPGSRSRASRRRRSPDASEERKVCPSRAGAGGGLRPRGGGGGAGGGGPRAGETFLSLPRRPRGGPRTDGRTDGPASEHLRSFPGRGPAAPPRSSEAESPRSGAAAGQNGAGGEGTGRGGGRGEAARTRRECPSGFLNGPRVQTTNQRLT